MAKMNMVERFKRVLSMLLCMVMLVSNTSISFAEGLPVATNDDGLTMLSSQMEENGEQRGRQGHPLSPTLLTRLLFLMCLSRRKRLLRRKRPLRPKRPLRRRNPLRPTSLKAPSFPRRTTPSAEIRLPRRSLPRLIR